MNEWDSDHPNEELLLLLEGRLDGEERRLIEEHLEQCDECREELAFIEKLGPLLENLDMGAETCPSLLTLMKFHYGELDSETERHVKGHLINCRKCAEEVTALEQEDEICEELLREPVSVTTVHSTNLQTITLENSILLGLVHGPNNLFCSWADKQPVGDG